MSAPSTHNVRFLQHNCARSRNVMHSILETAVKTADIVLLQEPWIGPNNTTVGHPSFNAICPNYTPRNFVFEITREPLDRNFSNLLHSNRRPRFTSRAQNWNLQLLSLSSFLSLHL